MVFGHICAIQQRIARQWLFVSAILLFNPLAAWAIDLVDVQEAYEGVAIGSDEEAGGWRQLMPGLEYAELKMPQNDSVLSVLRIEPRMFDFILCAASEDGKGPRSLSQWASEKGLAAAINPSMYLPDNRTSTGYMRQGSHVNNPKIVKRFGAFFVAGPRREGLPPAAIIDRDTPGWRALLDDYELVIQNYRMINAARRVLWAPGGPRYSISAIGQDGSGRILFLHSRKPVDAYSFASELLTLPIDIRTVMYVEGGAQAGLVVDAGGLKREFGAPHAPSFIITGNFRAILPNALGISPK